MPEAKVGVIGGTGLYQLDSLKDVRTVNVDTPFGSPSDSIVIGKLGNIGVAFLPRHGRGHRFLPTEIPVKANIYALKSLGVERIISVSAVGSLKDNIKPMDVVVPDQLIDRTKSRVNSFFGNGIAAHVGFAEPFCPILSEVLERYARTSGAIVHRGGTYVVMEGPVFSTKAESNLYRSWGASVIGMTALPEAKLAREAEMCYATMAMVTDYDCWHDTEEPVSVGVVIANLQKNVAMSRKILEKVISGISSDRYCTCKDALKGAIVTAPEHMSEETKRVLGLLIDKYVQGTGRAKDAKKRTG